ncbi:conserved hypothetical protein [Streptomyces sp. SPB78]|nr:conserved hypothetical protein [Streptomyces sp. SPB78]
MPVEVKALLRHHGGLATARVEQRNGAGRGLSKKTKQAHFGLPRELVAVEERQVLALEEDKRIPAAGRVPLVPEGGWGCAPVGVALDAELGLLVDQPFFTVREEAAVNDLAYVNKCLRDHVTKDYLGVAFVQGGLLVVKVRGEATGSVWFCPYDDARDRDGLDAAARVRELLLPCGEDFDAFLSRLAGSPPELETVAQLMVDGGFARVVPVGE